MLPLFNSRKPFATGLVEHECPRCHREVELPLGQLCRQCRAEIHRRAARIGNLVALISTGAVAVYVWANVAPGDQLGRNVGIAGIAVWFILSNMVTRRVARELIK